MNTGTIRYILDLIDEKSIKLSNAQSAFANDDQFAMAECDPGMQFELSNEIEDHWLDIHNLTE